MPPTTGPLEVWGRHPVEYGVVAYPGYKLAIPQAGTGWAAKEGPWASSPVAGGGGQAERRIVPQEVRVRLVPPALGTKQDEGVKELPGGMDDELRMVWIGDPVTV